MTVRDLISAAFNKDATSFEASLNAVMQEKMSAAIQARFSPAVYEEEVDLSEANDEDDEDEEDEDEEDELEEALKIGSKVRIHAPGKDYHGKIGHVGEIRKRTYGTMAPSYTVDYREPGEDYNRSVSLSREKMKLHKEEVDQIDEISTELKKRYVEKGADDVVDRFTSRGKYERPYDPSKYTKTGRPKKSAVNSPEAVKYREKLDNRRDIVNKVSQEVHGKKRFGEEVELDEISGAKLGTYLIKARKAEAELDKKRDDSYDKPNTPENKAERKAISRTLNKRRWGHGKALDKLTGSSFAKVHATEK